MFAMPTLQVTFDDLTRAAAEARAADGGFASVDGYLASLVDADVAVPVSAALEAELLAGLDGVGRTLTPADWDARQRAVSERFGLPTAGEW